MPSRRNGQSSPASKCLPDARAVLSLDCQQPLRNRGGITGRRPCKQLRGEALGDHRRLASIAAEPPLVG
jgi:hypothetical protein